MKVSACFGFAPVFCSSCGMDWSHSRYYSWVQRGSGMGSTGGSVALHKPTPASRPLHPAPSPRARSRKHPQLQEKPSWLLHGEHRLVGSMPLIATMDLLLHSDGGVHLSWLRDIIFVFICLYRDGNAPGFYHKWERGTLH